MSIIKKLKKKTSISKDYIFKTLEITDTTITLLFSEVLTSTNNINDFILRQLTKLRKKDLKALENHLPDTNILKIKNKEILDYVNKGFLVIITPYYNYAIEVKTSLERGITNITSELSLTGPKDSFSENFNTNLGLIRRRIKTTDLRCEDMEIGRSTKTKIGILYMNNIVKKDIVKKIKKQLKLIDIDGIIDSSYLKRNLEYRNTFFPTVMMSERPDKSCMALLEGKVVILVDMSPYVIILPNFFLDYFHTVDDYYQKPSNITFIRIIRLIAFLIAILTPAIYISVTTRNYDLIPTNLLLMLKAGRTSVPFPAYLEALFMIIAFEILKESDLRMSNTSNSAVSILGGLILGDAAVSAGIVSPIMIIIIAISSIAGLVFTSLELVNAIRIYKIFFLILATFLGIYGVIIGTALLIYKLLQIKVFDIPYLAPLVPFIKTENNDTFIKHDHDIKLRNPLLSNNTIRGKYK